MEARKNILVLGAGYAGVTAVKELAKQLKKERDQYRIVLIDRHAYHTLLTDLHEVAGGRVQPEAVQLDLRKLCSGLGVDVLVDEIVGIDYKLKQVHLKGCDPLPYEFLVMGLGSQPSYFGIKGVEEYGLPLWSFEDAVNIRQHIVKQFEKARGIQNEQKRKQALTFAVAGGGFTGVEMAGELGEWVKTLAHAYDVKVTDTRVILVEAMGKVCPMFDEKQARKIVKRLGKLRVEVLLNSPITEAQKDGFTIKGDQTIACSTLIWTAGIKGNDLVGQTGIDTGKQARALANNLLQATNDDSVYLIGDNLYLEQDGKPLLQVVETAVQSAAHVAHNIAAKIKGKTLEPFTAKYHGFMVSVGGRYAVADVMGMKLSSIFAMGLKHLVNLHYLWEIGGFAMMWHYMYHEFFSMTQNRSIIGGHASRSTPVFFLVPLRVYIGVMWLLEGIKKVQDGWLKPENIFIIQIDGVSGASEAWEEGAEAVAQIVPIFDHPPAIYQWFMDTFIAQAPFLFQASVVLMEIAYWYSASSTSPCASTRAGGALFNLSIGLPAEFSKVVVANGITSIANLKGPA